MMNNSKKIISAFCLALSFLFISIQGQTNKPVKSIASGVVNGKAVALPVPEYPVEARQAGITGTVNVQVVIDETGKVISAKTVDGVNNAALRKAAEAAALKATFLPTTLSGEPVKVTGIIIYNFVKPVSNEEKLKILGLSSFLFSLKYFANDMENYNKIFESDDIIKETVEEFSSVAPELSKLNTLKNLSAKERGAKIDEVIISVKKNLNSSDQWQFQTGEAFAGILSQFFLAGINEEVDLNKFDEAAIKTNLVKINTLIATAPDDFPKDVLVKLREFSELSSRDTFLTEENWEEFSNKFMSLMETISPDSTK